MSFAKLSKLAKSRNGVLSILLAILSGLFIGLIACHLYNLNKAEAFTNPQMNESYEVKFDFDKTDPKSMSDLKNAMNAVMNKKTNTTTKGVTSPYTNNEVMDNDSNVESPGTKIQMDANSLSDFYRKLPKGVPKNSIPEGDEDLYILKSEIVPPVCPACPTFNCPREKPCPPCPAPKRCPEPAFECKKVPNYSAASVEEYLPSASNFFGMSSVDDKSPRPVLTDFSQFN